MYYNVLLVDDSATIRAILAKAICMSGLNINIIYQASNGQEAFDILSSNWIDLVITDLNMPVVNGIELIEKIGQNVKLKSIPVIVVSTKPNLMPAEEMCRKGISGYIQKPFTPEIIKENMAEILGGNSNV